MDHKTRMKEVQGEITNHRTKLYETLGEIYKFGIETLDDVDAFGDYVKKAYKKNKWKAPTKATFRNIFNPCVRLAFNSDDEGINLDAQPISKYAAALKYLDQQNVGYTMVGNSGRKIKSTIVADSIAKLTNVNGITEAAKLSMAPTDETEAANKKAAKQKLALDTLAKMEGSDDGISIDDKLVPTEKITPEGYVAVLARVENGELTVVDDLDWDVDRINAHLRAAYGGSPGERIAGKNASFKALYNTLRVTDVVEVGKNEGKIITIQNTKDGAVVHASNTNTRVTENLDTVVVTGEMPRIEGLENGTYILYTEDADNLKHLWGQASKFEWMAETRSAGPAVVLSGHDVKTWLAEKDDQGKLKRTKRKRIAYNTDTMVVQLTDKPHIDKQPVRLDYDIDIDVKMMPLPAIAVKEYLAWVRDGKPGAGETQIIFDGNNFTLRGTRGKYNRTIYVDDGEDVAKVTPNDVDDEAIIRLGSLTRAIRNLSSISDEGMEIGLSPHLVIVRLTNDEVGTYTVHIPRKLGLDWSGDAFEKVKTAFEPWKKIKAA